MRVPRDTGVVARIRAELEANDWRVREIGPDASSARSALPPMAASARARAALRMQPSRGAIELWVASESDGTGASELVRLPAGEQDDGLLALRATEALRARGLRLPRRPESSGGSATEAPAAVSGGGASAVGGGSSPSTPTSPATAAATSTTTTPRGDPAAAEADERARKQAEQARAEREARERAAREQAERERAEREARAQAEREAREAAEAQAEADDDAEAREAEAEEEEDVEEEEGESGLPETDGAPLLFVEVGPAFAASPGGVAIGWAGWLNVRLQPDSLWSLDGFGFVPFAGGTVREGGASATMRSYMAGASLDLHGTVERVELSAGAGAALLITQMRADTSTAEFMSNDDALDFTTAAIARIGLHVAASTQVRVGVRAVFGLALPKLQMKFDREAADPVATWGHPFLLAVLAVDFGLPAPRR